MSDIDSFDMDDFMGDAIGVESMDFTTLPGTQDSTQARKKHIRRKGGKRSSKACGSCRTRKVRCNVVVHGVPCSNCEHDEVECMIPDKRRRVTKSERKPAQSVIEPRPENQNSAQSANGTHTTSELGLMPPPPLSISSHESFHTPSTLQQSEPSGDISMSSLPEMNSSSRTVSWVQSPLASAVDKTHTTPQPRPTSSLSDIFSTFPPHIGVRELTYLKSHDALTLPSEELQIELLKAYIEFVHGLLPVLDLEDFLSVVKYGGGNGSNPTVKNPSNRISFLLFQAVMFAASGYVSSRVLVEAGYPSRDAAKRIFFNRVKLLYDFNTCSDRLTICQSLLLMTLCPTNRTSQKVVKDAWHWLGLAISLCYVLGLNRDLPSSTPSNPRRKHLERRIWWITFIRDRTLSLRASFEAPKAVRIRKEDSHIPMLCQEDFDLDENAARYEGIDELRMMIIAQECVERAMMYWCTKDSMVSKFAAGNARSSSSSHTDTSLPTYFLPKQPSLESYRNSNATSKPQNINTLDILNSTPISPPTTFHTTSSSSEEESIDIFINEDEDGRYCELPIHVNDPVAVQDMSQYDDFLEFLGLESQVSLGEQKGKVGEGLELDEETARTLLAV